MVKENIEEKCKKYIESDGIKTIYILMENEEIRKENVGDFSDSVKYTLEKCVEGKIDPKKAEKLNEDLKVEMDRFEKNVNRIFLHN